MNQYLFPLLLLCLISCADNGIVKTEVAPIELTDEKPDYEGHWIFVSAQKVANTPFLSTYPNRNEYAREEGPQSPPYIGPDIIFDNDSMYKVYDQVHLVKPVNYSIDQGYLYSHFKRFNDSIPVELANDSLFIYKPYLGNEYVKEGYVKTELNDSLFSILKKYGVNYPELAGTWYLIRESIQSGEDGSYWEYELEFPHTLPDSIHVSREQFINGLANNMIYMMTTDGKEQSYFFNIRWDMLFLTPGDWYKGENPGIHFEKRKPDY